MENNLITKLEKMERTAVFNKEMTKRYEFTISLEVKKEKSILVLCMNPASNNVQIMDNTTNYLLNNLLPMGFTTITVCNIFATICPKLKPSKESCNDENLGYIEQVLERNFHTVLVGYGNTFLDNKRVNEEKAEVDIILKKYEGNLVELVDQEGIYSRLKTIHPLFAGQRFTGKWKFRKYFVEEGLKKEEK